MAQCVYCNAETQLYLSNVPVCIQCADARNPEQKRGRLFQNVADATMRADAASGAFQKVLEEIPSDIPHRDGEQRIRDGEQRIRNVTNKLRDKGI